MIEWQKIKLGDAPLEIIDGDRGKNYPKRNEFFDSGFCLFLNAKNVTRTGFSFSELNFITQTKDERLRKGKLKRGDLVLTTRGTVGNVAYYDKEIPYKHMRINSGMVIIRPAGIDERFNYYLFKFLNNQIKVFTSGTAQPQLPIRDLVKIPIFLPPLSDQCAISGFLSTFDKKIKLLHRQNQTLEALAQTLFRQWFVEEAEDDWEVGKLGDLVEFNYGKGLKKSIRTGMGYPVVGSSGIVDYHAEYLVEGPGIVTGRKGTLGEVIYFFDNFYPIDTTFFVKTKKDSPNLYYEYYLLKTIGFKKMNTDSAVPGLNRNNALSVEVIIPPQNKISQFNDFVHLLFQKRKANQTQIHTLEKLRDILLHKLLNGEVQLQGGHD